MADLDSIWADMQGEETSARKIYKQKITQRTVLPNFNKPDKKSKKGKKDKKDKKGKKAKEFTIHGVTRERKKATGDDLQLSVAKAEPFESAEALLAECQRDINCATDSSCTIKVRKASIEKIYQILVQTEQKDDVLRAGFENTFKSFLKLFSDPVELIRDRSIRIVIHFMRVQKDIGIYLPYLYPVLMSRIQSGYGYDYEQNVFFRSMDDHVEKTLGRVKEVDKFAVLVVEPSEEVRLLCCSLMRTLIDVCVENNSQPVLQPYFHETVVFAQAQVADPFPELKIAGSELLVALSRHFSSGTKHYAIGLVKSVMTSLDHRHAKVRLAVMKAVWELVACPKPEKCKGAATEAIPDLIGHRDANVLPIASFYISDTTVNYFAKFSIDRSQPVRLQFYTMLGAWMTKLPDRFDYFSRIVPYVLTGLTDDSGEINHLCMDNLKIIGAEHESEHKDDVVVRRQYGVDGDEHANHDKPLPHPFAERPRIGVRMFVRGHTRRFIGPLTRELTSWLSKTRSQAALLFQTVVVFMEEHMTVDAHTILKTMYQVIHDDEIGEVISGIVELIGRFIDPATYVPLVVPMLSGDLEVNPNPTSANRAATLAVLSKLLEGSRPVRVLPHVETLATLLSDQEIGSTESLLLKRALCDAIVSLTVALQAHGKGGAVSAHFRETGRLKSMEPMFTSLLRVLLQLKSVPELTEDCVKGIGALAKAEEKASEQELYDSHFEALLQEATADFPFSGLWSAACGQQVVLGALEVVLDALLQSASAGSVRAHLLTVCRHMGSVATQDFGEKQSEPAKLHNGKAFLALLQQPELWTPAPSLPSEELLSVLLGSCLLEGCWDESTGLQTARLQMLAAVVLGQGDADPIAGEVHLRTHWTGVAKVLLSCIDSSCQQVTAPGVEISAMLGPKQRALAAQLCEPLIVVLHGLDDEERQGFTSLFEYNQLYRALLSRLDDSNELVRLAVLESLREFMPLLDSGTDEPQVIEVTGSAVDLDAAERVTPTYRHFLRACLAQLRIGESSNSDSFKMEMIDIMREAAAKNTTLFLEEVRRQNKLLRTNDFEDLIDHAELIDTLRSRSKGKGKGK